MEKAFAKAEEFAESVKEYLDIRIESAKLTVAEKTSLVLANAAAGIAVVVAFIFFTGLLAVGLSLVLGEWLGKTWAGFMIMAGIFFIMAIIIWISRKKIVQLPLMNALIKQLFNNDEKDEAD